VPLLLDDGHNTEIDEEGVQAVLRRFGLVGILNRPQ
jgi:hypothetical protein